MGKSKESKKSTSRLEEEEAGHDPEQHDDQENQCSSEENAGKSECEVDEGETSAEDKNRSGNEDADKNTDAETLKHASSMASPAESSTDADKSQSHDAVGAVLNGQKGDDEPDSGDAEQEPEKERKEEEEDQDKGEFSSDSMAVRENADEDEEASQSESDAEEKTAFDAADPAGTSLSDGAETLSDSESDDDEVRSYRPPAVADDIGPSVDPLLAASLLSEDDEFRPTPDVTPQFGRRVADQVLSFQKTIVSILDGETADAAVERIGSSFHDALIRIAELEKELEAEMEKKQKYKQLARKYYKLVARKSDPNALDARTKKGHSSSKSKSRPARSESVASTGSDSIHKHTRKISSLSGSNAPQRQSSKVFDDDDPEYEQFNDEEQLEDNPSALVIESATPQQLVNRLAGRKPIDGEFVRDFVVVYAQFIETDVLLQLLTERYFFRAPENSDEKVRAYFEEWRGPVQMRVINIMRKWVEMNPAEFTKSLADTNSERSERVQARFVEFKAALEASGKGEWAERLQSSLEERQTAQTIVAVRPIDPSHITTPVFPKKMKIDSEIHSFDDFDPLELGRQLTLFEWELFSRVSPNELRSGLWEKDKTKNLCPGVLGITTWFNLLCNWIVTDIVSRLDVKDRTRTISRWISIGEFCMGVGNFHLVCEVVAALNKSSIARLKSTWTGVSKSKIKVFEEMTELMGGGRNYHVYRERLAVAEKPVVPYLGVFLKDLLAIEAGNPDTANFRKAGPQTKERVSWAKMRMIADNVHRIQEAQADRYAFGPIPAAQQFFERHLRGSDEERKDIVTDEKAQYELSRQCEGIGGTPQSAPTLRDKSDKDFGTMRLFRRKSGRPLMSNSSAPGSPRGRVAGVAEQAATETDIAAIDESSSTEPVRKDKKRGKPEKVKSGQTD